MSDDESPVPALDPRLVSAPVDPGKDAPPAVKLMINVMHHGNNCMNSALRGSIGMSVLSIGHRQEDFSAPMYFQAPEGYSPEHIRQLLYEATIAVEKIILAMAEKTPRDTLQ